MDETANQVGYAVAETSKDRGLGLGGYAHLQRVRSVYRPGGTAALERGHEVIVYCRRSLVPRAPERRIQGGRGQIYLPGSKRSDGDSDTHAGVLMGDVLFRGSAYALMHRLSARSRAATMMCAPMNCCRCALQIPCVRRA